MQVEPEALAAERLIYLATLRKDGSQSTAAPKWFTTGSDRAILVQTRPASWLARRIRRGSRVILWIGNPRGAAFIASAEITSDREVIRLIVADFRRKYLLVRLGIHRPTQKKFDQGSRVAIKLVPIQALPQGFESQPGVPAPGGVVGTGQGE